MPHKLRVESVTSASRLRGALAPGECADLGEFEDGILTVANQERAQKLVDRYHNVSWADDAPDERRQSQITRANADTEGVSYECGVNGCSRTVQSPELTCWQHTEDDSED